MSEVYNSSEPLSIITQNIGFLVDPHTGYQCKEHLYN